MPHIMSRRAIPGKKWHFDIMHADLDSIKEDTTDQDLVTTPQNT